MTLSSYQAKALLEARAAGKTRTRISPDLNLSKVEVYFNEIGVMFPNGILVGWDALQKIRDSGRKCFRFSDQGIWEIMLFSETTRLLRALAATEGAPTMLVSGKPMHRIKEIDPLEDTKRKISTLSPVRGRVLDTATGLGYTAIEAARTASSVVTVELDPTAIEIARYNPWSEELFSNTKIRQFIGDVVELIHEFESGSFDIVIHDPPTKALAGEMYSLRFYEQLWRVLDHRGRLFHYAGDPNSSLGARTTEGVIRRLYEAGFKKVVRRPEAFGVLAFKSSGDRRGGRGTLPKGIRTKRRKDPSNIRLSRVRAADEGVGARFARTLWSFVATLQAPIFGSLVFLLARENGVSPAFRADKALGCSKSMERPFQDESSNMDGSLASGFESWQFRTLRETHFAKIAGKFANFFECQACAVYRGSIPRDDCAFDANEVRCCGSERDHLARSFCKAFVRENIVYFD